MNEFEVSNCNRHCNNGVIGKTANALKLTDDRSQQRKWCREHGNLGRRKQSLSCGFAKSIISSDHQFSRRYGEQNLDKARRQTGNREADQHSQDRS